MSTKEILIALTIHIFIPLAGFIYFIRIIRQMAIENVVKAPILELFIIFSTYGSLLIIVLTTLFWKWSAMASLGAAYLTIGAPIFMVAIALRHRKTKINSKYHKLAYLSGLLYFIIASVAFLILFLMRLAFGW